MSVDDHYELSQTLMRAQDMFRMVLQELPAHHSQRGGIEDVLELLETARDFVRRPEVKQALCELPEDPPS